MLAPTIVICVVMAALVIGFVVLVWSQHGYALESATDFEVPTDVDAIADHDERPAQRDYQLNPVAIAVAVLGQVICWVGIFLPATQNPGVFSQIVNNALIERGFQTWSIVVVGAILVITLGWLYQQKRRPSLGTLLAPIVLLATTAPLLAGGPVYPAGANGKAETSLQSVHGAAGVGIYAVVFGAVLIAIGLIGTWLTATPVGDPNDA